MEYKAEQSILPRAAHDSIERAAKVAPVVVLLGARQTGKTTLLKETSLLKGRPYLSLDDFDLRAQAQSEPEARVARSFSVVFDEVQRARNLLIAVKRAVDSDPTRSPGRFFLTGSANLLMMEQVSETLAGRAVYVTLWPFTRPELLGLGQVGLWSEILSHSFSAWGELLNSQPDLFEDWATVALRGGLPVPSYHLSQPDERSLWFSGYVQTYLERDLQALRAVENLADFRRLMRAACLRIGNLVNQTELGRDVGIVQPQVHRFLNLLETSFQVIRLPSYSINRTRRLIKTPKLYWSDSALAMFLGAENQARGVHLENMILTDLIAWRDLQIPRSEILYWRTASGLEVDFVIETPKRLLPIEVKSSNRVSLNDASGLMAFLDEYPEMCDGGLLLYAGQETFLLTKKILVAPWWKVI